LTLGCALLERIPQLKPKPMTVYQMLALLRSCLTRSSDVKNLYKNNTNNILRILKSFYLYILDKRVGFKYEL